MGNFRNKLASFFYGRNGIDALYNALVVVCLLLGIINLFIRTTVISIIIFCILIFAVFRLLSKNLEMRRRENAAFLRLWEPCKKYFVRTAHRIRDIKTKRYRKCPNCKVVLRLPLRKGKSTIVCPRCGSRFDVNIKL